MKHVGFLKSLKALKSQLSKKDKSYKYIFYQSSTKSVCICKDGNGEFKYLYKTKDELEYILASKSIKLKPFPCPYEKGWHLTRV